MSNFKKTIKTIALFFLVFILLNLGIMGVYLTGENFYYQDARERAELSGTLDFLVFGSSHVMRSVIPDILDEELGVNSYNMAISSASMQEHYEMLTVEAERNPVDTVILGVSYDTMTRNREERGAIESDFYVLSKLDFWHQVPYFFSALEPSEYIRMYYEFLNKGFECIDMAVRGTWHAENDKIDKGFVSYYSLHNEGDNTDILVTEYSDIYNTEVLPEKIDESSVEYLDKILELCNENDIQLIMIDVPMSKTFISLYQNLDASRSWYAEYAQNNDIEFFDFNLYKEIPDIFSDDVDFHDINHMNSIGAEKFTKLFASFYMKLENDEDVEDLFYDSYDEMKSIVFEN